MKKLAVLASLLFLAATVHAQFREYLSEEEKYNRLIEDSMFWVNAPIILEDSIVFYYRGEARKVIVAGDFNNWRIEYPMTYNPTNKLWTFRWQERLSHGVYRYKFVVDDIWIADPFNTNIQIDRSGQPVSYFTLGEDFIPNKTYPLMLSNRIYRFHYHDLEAVNVSLVGDFNNWNPYANPMRHTGEGFWDIDVLLKPGIHIYCFVVDEQWIPDPLNLKQYSDRAGNIVNVLFVPGRRTPYDTRRQFWR